MVCFLTYNDIIPGFDGVYGAPSRVYDLVRVGVLTHPGSHASRERSYYCSVNIPHPISE